jgi:hypothetical protein
MRTARGQAAVELSLGMIVLVTILMFGIHFGEMGYLGAKIHEAAASALWDSTAYRTHQLTPVDIPDTPTSPDYDSTPAVLAVVDMGNPGSAASRYQDFDGRSSANGTAPTMALTQAQPIAVTCNKAGDFTLGYPSPFGEPGGITCSAQADLAVLHMLTNFLDVGGSGSAGFFKENQVHRQVSTLCSSGRFKGGSCGSIQMLLGDDALHHGFNEENECTLTRIGEQPCGDNPNFYNVAHKVFAGPVIGGPYAGRNTGFTGVPESLAAKIIPDVPDKVTGFFMSFKGEDSNFNEVVPDGEVWETNPHNVPLESGQPYLNAYTYRKFACSGTYCYLGKINCD